MTTRAIKLPDQKFEAYEDIRSKWAIRKE
jgi:hypothetical protein